MSSSMANQPLPASSNSGLPIHHPATKASDHPGQRCKTSSSKLNSKPTSREAITIILIQKLPLEGIRQPRQTRPPPHNQPLGHHLSSKQSIELAAIAICHRASPLAAKSTEQSIQLFNTHLNIQRHQTTINRIHLGKSAVQTAIKRAIVQNRIINQHRYRHQQQCNTNIVSLPFSGKQHSQDGRQRPQHATDDDDSTIFD